jgi:flagellar biosynthesis/type III secretory pathway M-ring protein FliF/YscJ
MEARLELKLFLASIKIMLTALFWKKVWTWIKHHWYVPVIIILILVFSLTKNSIKNKLYKMLANQRELYEKEKQLINETNREKELEKERVRRRHKDLVKRLEEEYSVELDKLKEDKQEELAGLSKQYEGNEEELAKKIAESLGVEYVPPGGE